jgi:hypothetical protein
MPSSAYTAPLVRPSTVSTPAMVRSMAEIQKDVGLSAQAR